MYLVDGLLTHEDPSGGLARSFPIDADLAGRGLCRNDDRSRADSRTIVRAGDGSPR